MILYKICNAAFKNESIIGFPGHSVHDTGPALVKREPFSACVLKMHLNHLYPNNFLFSSAKIYQMQDKIYGFMSSPSTAPQGDVRLAC